MFVSALKMQSDENFEFTKYETYIAIQDFLLIHAIAQWLISSPPQIN